MISFVITCWIINEFEKDIYPLFFDSENYIQNLQNME